MSEVERVETMHDECGCSELQDIAGLGMDEWMNGWDGRMAGWLLRLRPRTTRHIQTCYKYRGII